MTITFYSDNGFAPNEKYERAMLDFFDSIAVGEPIVFLVNYEFPFMHFAIECIKKYKQARNDVKTFFISPYSEGSYDKETTEQLLCEVDKVFFTERTLFKSCVLRGQCNAHMMRDSDCTVAYIESEDSTAYLFCRNIYAYGKDIYSLTEDGVKKYIFKGYRI